MPAGDDGEAMETGMGRHGPEEPPEAGSRARKKPRRRAWLQNFARSKKKGQEKILALSVTAISQMGL